MREADVRDQPFAEKSGYASACAIDELVGNHEIERLVLFLERAHRAERKNALDAQRFHAPDVGAKVQFRGRDAMPAAVPREKRNFLARQLAHDIGVRRRAPGRRRPCALHVFQIPAWSTVRCRQ